LEAIASHDTEKQMSWPAKYFVVQASIDDLAASVDKYLGGHLSASDDTQTPQGFKGMDYYLSFWIRNVAGGLMVNEIEADGGSEALHVIAYAVPGLLGRSKAVGILEGIVGSVPGAKEQPFPDGPRAGDLAFV
jgi:hypothetical protein